MKIPTNKIKKIVISLFLVPSLFVVIFGISSVAFAVSVVESENSYLLCHDAIDNDDNGSTDMADVNCAAFAGENSTTTPPVTPPSGGGGGSISSSGSFLPGFGGSLSVPIAQIGSVLGTSTDTDSPTCELFKTYMRKGETNDKYEVTKLQRFLNEQLNSNLPLTGFFGSLTDKAVRNFQLLHSDTVLVPWVNAGLMKFTMSTGYFYKTTQHEANKILCPGVVLPEPILP